MANLFFPQLASGAIAQYPIRKTSVVSTVKNVLPDGSMLVYRYPNAPQNRIWQLVYNDLDVADMQALAAHFSACAGPLHAFTFIDPTENMLAWSSDLRMPPWASLPLVQMTPGLPDPAGGNGGFTVTNVGEAYLEITQSLTVPASYQYCLSLYAMSAQASQLVLSRRGASAEQSMTFPVGTSWTRAISSGRLQEAGTQLTIAIGLAAGQQVSLYGVQLEPQVTPSRYRATASNGGIYANAHWGVDQLTTVAEAPNLYSTSFSIEAVIKD